MTSGILEAVQSSLCAPSQMSDVKRLPERLDCMLFRVRFDEEIGELQPVAVSTAQSGRMCVCVKVIHHSFDVASIT